MNLLTRAATVQTLTLAAESVFAEDAKTRSTFACFDVQVCGERSFQTLQTLAMRLRLVLIAAYALLGVGVVQGNSVPPPPHTPATASESSPTRPLSNRERDALRRQRRHRNRAKASVRTTQRQEVSTSLSDEQKQELTKAAQEEDARIQKQLEAQRRATAPTDNTVAENAPASAQTKEATTVLHASAQQVQDELPPPPPPPPSAEDSGLEGELSSQKNTSSATIDSELERLKAEALDVHARHDMDSELERLKSEAQQINLDDDVDEQLRRLQEHASSRSSTFNYADSEGAAVTDIATTDQQQEQAAPTSEDEDVLENEGRAPANSAAEDAGDNTETESVAFTEETDPDSGLESAGEPQADTDDHEVHVDVDEVADEGTIHKEVDAETESTSDTEVTNEEQEFVEEDSTASDEAFEVRASEEEENHKATQEATKAAAIEDEATKVAEASAVAEEEEEEEEEAERKAQEAAEKAAEKAAAVEEEAAKALEAKAVEEEEERKAQEAAKTAAAVEEEKTKALEAKAVAEEEGRKAQEAAEKAAAVEEEATKAAEAKAVAEEEQRKAQEAAEKVAAVEEEATKAAEAKAVEEEEERKAQEAAEKAAAVEEEATKAAEAKAVEEEEERKAQEAAEKAAAVEEEAVKAAKAAEAKAVAEEEEQKSQEAAAVEEEAAKAAERESAKTAEAEAKASAEAEAKAALQAQLQLAQALAADASAGAPTRTTNRKEGTDQTSAGTGEIVEPHSALDTAEAVDQELKRLQAPANSEPDQRLDSELQQLASLRAEIEATVHRDIKPDNIFVHDDERQQRPYLVLGDIGLAKTLSRSASFVSAAGAVAYRAPEACTDAAKCSQASDVYSVSLVAVELVTGRCVYSQSNGDLDVGARLAADATTKLGSALEFCGDAWLSSRAAELLLQACTIQDPTARPSFQAIVSMCPRHEKTLQQVQQAKEAQREQQLRDFQAKEALHEQQLRDMQAALEAANKGQTELRPERAAPQQGKAHTVSEANKVAGIMQEVQQDQVQQVETKEAEGHAGEDGIARPQTTTTILATRASLLALSVHCVSSFHSLVVCRSSFVVVSVSMG